MRIGRGGKDGEDEEGEWVGYGERGKESEQENCEEWFFVGLARDLRVKARAEGALGRVID